MDILFSLLYIENYRTIKNLAISFDHNYECELDSVSDTIVVRNNKERDKIFGKYFYGKNIYSVTCLVGKNGEGKTSLVDFLRDSFVLIKNDIDIGYLADGELFYNETNGFLDLTKRKAKYYHLDESTHFFVIFKKNGENCYLTNIEDQRIKWSEKDICRAYEPEKGGKGLEYQIAYFSMMRFLDSVSKAEMVRNRREDAQATHISDRFLSYEEIIKRYNIDFSEEEMNQKRKEKEGKPGINADLFMQLAFLKNGREEHIKTILGEDYQSRVEVANIDFFGEGGKGCLGIDELTGTSVWDEILIREIIESPLAYLRPFSSGQYSRLAFLARLYWYMGGGEKFWKSPNMKRTVDVVDKVYRAYRDELKWLEQAQFKSETVVLLIDEGELYYHPEWQRSFVSDVFDIIKEYGENEKSADVQVIFTTSSTFMLSDILREDVVVLSKPNEMQESYLDKNLQTFGQNIHMLLANRFFMDSTIGKGAEELITSLFDMLTIRETQIEGNQKTKKEEPTEVRKRIQEKVQKMYPAYIEVHKDCFDSESRYDDFIYRLILNIGEEFYRRQLLGLFEEYKRYVRKDINALSTKLKEAQSILEKSKTSQADVESAIALLEEIRKEGML